jgi:hypothetical protein
MMPLGYEGRVDVRSHIFLTLGKWLSQCPSHFGRGLWYTYTLKRRNVEVEGNVLTPLAEIEVRLLSDPYQSLFRYGSHNAGNKEFVEYFLHVPHEVDTTTPFGI